MLRLNSIGVQIGAVRLLDQIDLEVPAGQVMAVVGPNGAGKSTLIKAIAGEQALTNGSISFHDRAIEHWPAQQLARHMAVLPQRSILTFPFTGREVVELSRTPHATGIVEDNTIVDEVLGYLDASHLADRFYTHLSGGEQQRIQLARVLAQIWRPSESSRLLLLDEPSSYFDLAHQQLLVQLVRELSDKNIAILVVLHDLNLAMSCADTIAVLCCGQLHACGPAEQVLDEKCIEQVFGVSARFIVDAATGQRHIGLSYNKPDIQE